MPSTTPKGSAAGMDIVRSDVTSVSRYEGLSQWTCRVSISEENVNASFHLKGDHHLWLCLFPSIDKLLPESTMRIYRCTPAMLQHDSWQRSCLGVANYRGSWWSRRFMDAPELCTVWRSFRGATPNSSGCLVAPHHRSTLHNRYCSS
jgi:hypothetical protein